MGLTGTGASPLDALGGWPVILTALSSGRDLSRDEATAAMAAILDGAATPAQMAAFIVSLRIKGETTEEMSGLVSSMLAAAEPLVLPGELLDTCGTGGDRRNSINVSTIAAFVAAGAGARVCKHGNRAQSSAAGSADVLEALGVVIDLGPDGVARCVEETGMGFCLAPRFHPSMRHVGPVRRELGIPTVFNFLGPLANPARARHQVVGVSDPAMAPRMLGVLRALGSHRVMVFYGHDGLDELSTTAPSTVLELCRLEGGPAEVRTYDVDATELGLARAEPEELRGGDASFNAAALQEVLSGTRGPHRDLVLLNAAAALVVSGHAAGLPEGLEVAAGAIDDGSATAVLDALVRVSLSCSAT